MGGTKTMPTLSSRAATIAPMTRTAGDSLFEHAPPMGIQRRLGLFSPDNLNVNRRALLVILVGWLPLVVFAAVQTLSARTDVLTPLLWEVGVHARYLVAAPLLVLAEAICAPRLNAIVHHFVASGLVENRDRFDEAVASTRRLLQSSKAEFVVIALAYGIALAAAFSFPVDQLPGWAVPLGGMPRYSLAGWWHTFVSLPLLLVLILGWFWRLALWTRLLWRISRLDLRLVASHPDRSAGLSFVGHSLRAFAIVALALSVIAAGRSAHTVLMGGGLPTPHLAFNTGLLVTIAVLFIAPLLVFTPRLLEVWQRGTLVYGALADRIGHAFERQWLHTRTTDESALEKPDFSATTDLYSIVANVQTIRLVPADFKDLIALVVAMLLPFVPVVLLAFPLDVIWPQIKNLLF